MYVYVAIYLEKCSRCDTKVVQMVFANVDWSICERRYRLKEQWYTIIIIEYLLFTKSTRNTRDTICMWVVFIVLNFLIFIGKHCRIWLIQTGTHIELTNKFSILSEGISRAQNELKCLQIFVFYSSVQWGLGRLVSCSDRTVRVE